VLCADRRECTPTLSSSSPGYSNLIEVSVGKIQSLNGCG